MLTGDVRSDQHDADRLRLPPVIFGSSALGNLYEVPSDERKLAIVQAWLENGTPNVLIDSAGKYGAGLALESIGNNLRRLQVDPDQVLISNKLGWYRTPLTTAEPTFEPGAWLGIAHDAQQRISRQGILDCWEQGCQLLGEPYRPQLVSVHDPDDYLAAASDADDLQRRRDDLFAAYESLSRLRDTGETQYIGVGSKDWRVAREISKRVDLDWVMIANSLTVFTHPPELHAWIEVLAARGVGVINSAVFNAGFLIGGDYFNYRRVSMDNAADRPLFDWRTRFMSLCHEHGIAPAAACIQFGLSPPGVQALALNTSHPERVAENVEMASESLPTRFGARRSKWGSSTQSILM